MTKAKSATKPTQKPKPAEGITPPAETPEVTVPLCGHKNKHYRAGEMFCELRPGHGGNHQAAYTLNGSPAKSRWSNAVDD